MSSSKEAFLINIVRAYELVKKEKQGKYWFTLKSWIKRTSNRENEYSFLLSKEPEFLNSYKDWFLSNYMELHQLKTQDLSEIIIYLKSFKDRLSHRSGFLVLIAALIAIASSVGAAIQAPEWLYANIFTGILVVLERHYLNEKATTIQELAYIVELARDNANKSSQPTPQSGAATF